jgi:Cys-rich protein (TIGR01571 family)
MERERDWDESLCGCTEHLSSCCVVALIPCGAPVLQGLAVRRAQNKEWIVPCLLCVILGCIGAGLNRTQIREAYGIDGTYLGDCCTHCFCSPCAICQEYRQTLRDEHKVL